MRNIILMTIAFVLFLIMMSVYSISNQAYGYNINSKEKNYVQSIYKT